MANKLSTTSALLVRALLLLVVAACLCAAMPAAGSDDPGDLLPDPTGDVDDGQDGQSPPDDGGSSNSNQGPDADPNPMPTMTPENLGDLKDIWSDPGVPELTFERPKSKYSPNGRLRNTMDGPGFARPKIRFGNYYIQGR